MLEWMGMWMVALVALHRHVFVDATLLCYDTWHWNGAGRSTYKQEKGDTTSVNAFLTRSFVLSLLMCLCFFPSFPPPFICKHTSNERYNSGPFLTITQPSVHVYSHSKESDHSYFSYYPIPSSSRPLTSTKALLCPSQKPPMLST
jgi:hypothetical protein